MPRLRSRRRRALGVIAALALYALAGVWLAADPARATRASDFDRIAPIQRAMQHEGDGRARLAGWSAQTRSGSSALDPIELADRFEAACAGPIELALRFDAHIEERTQALRGLTPTRAIPARPAFALGGPLQASAVRIRDNRRGPERAAEENDGFSQASGAIVRRWQDDDEAFVACLAPSDRDLHRTLHARRIDQRTRWTAVWSSELPSREALDAERSGADLPGVPRPPGARRMASASQDGARSVTYAPAADVRPSLERAGWRVVERDGVSLATRGSRAVFVVVAEDTVTFVESAAGSWSAP